MPRKTSKIPRFRSIQEEAAFWDTHDSEEFSDEWKEVELKVSKPLVHVVEVELVGRALRALEVAAKKEGTDAIGLIYRWIEERLRQHEVIPQPETAEAIERRLVEAIQGHRVALLWKRYDPYGAERTVEPHVLYEDKSGARHVSVYQTEGYSQSEALPGWRNIALDDIRSLTLLDATFEPRWAEGYKPDSKRRYPKVLAKA